MKRLVNLEMFTSKSHGVSDLLISSRFVAPSTILNIDGSITTSLILRPNDLEAETVETMNYIGEIIHRAFMPLDSGWCMHLDCMRLESAGYIPEEMCYFPDATTYSIDFERRMEYNRADKHYENEYVITFTYMPPGDFTSKVGAFFMTAEDNYKKANFDYGIYVEKFTDVIHNVIDVLTSSHFRIFLMTDNEILSHLFFCINGIRTNIKAPKRHWTDLRFMLANQDIVTGFYPTIGNKHLRVISMGEQFPLETYPTLLSALNSIGFEYRWSTRYIFLSPADASNRLKKLSELHYQKRESAGAVLSKKYGDGSPTKINRSAERYADEAEEVLSTIEMANWRYGYYTSCVVLMDEDLDLLNEKVKIIKGVIDNYNLMGKIEKAHNFEAYLGSIPSMVRPNVRKWFMSSYNLSDLLPTSAVWSGYKSNPCQYYIDAKNTPVLFYASTAGTPFRGCLHVGDEGHTLIIGANGALVMNFLAAQQCRYKNAKIFIFDAGHTSLALASSIPDSIHYDIGYGDNTIAFQPLAHLDSQEDFSFVVHWLCELCTVNGFEIKPSHITVIAEVLELIRREAQPTQRTINYFYSHICTKGEGMADLAVQFKPYTSISGRSLQNQIFDATTNSLHMKYFTVFEIGQLARRGDATLVPAILYLFHMIERGLDGSPVSIYLQDGWTIFKHPVFRSYLDDWLRKVAKLNVQIIIGVYQPSDITKSDLAGILMQACKTKIFTANLNARETQRSSYLDLGLNEPQIELIGAATVNRDYYFTSKLGSRLIQFQLGELASIFLTPPSLEQIKVIRELKVKYGALFGYQWIKQHHLLDEIADFWLNSHNKLQQNRSAAEQ